METNEQTTHQQQPKEQSFSDAGFNENEKATQTDTESEANNEPKTGLNDEEDAGNQTAGSASVTE